MGADSLCLEPLESSCVIQTLELFVSQGVENVFCLFNLKSRSHGLIFRLWGLFKHSKCDRKGVLPLKHQGNIITNAAAKATILNSYFQSVFTSHVPLNLKQLCENQCDRVFDHTPNSSPSMPPISITTAGIAKLLDNLKTRGRWA